MKKQTSRPLLETIERMTLSSPVGFISGFAIILIAVLLTISGELLLSALPLGIGSLVASMSVGVKEEDLDKSTPFLLTLPIERPSIGDIATSVLTLGVMLGLLVGINQLASQFGVTVIEVSPIPPSTAELVGITALMFLFVAPVEETLFRYALQDQLLLGTAPRRIITASVFFALVHPRLYWGLDPLTGVTQLVAIAALGAVLGFCYEWRRNLLVPILAHAAYNSIILALPLFPFVN